MTSVVPSPQPPHRSKSALVLGSDMRAFLTVVRSLGRAEIEVHVAWAIPKSPALRSRYIHKVHELQKAEPGDDRWIQQLISLIDREDRKSVV